MKVIISELINSKEIRKGERINRFNRGAAVVEEEKWRDIDGNITMRGFSEVILWHQLGQEVKITFINGKIRYCKATRDLIEKLEEL